MAHIAGRLTIAAPIETVFDAVVDTRNEPSYNPTMRSVELLTPEPIGRGTRFRALMGDKDLEMLVEVTEFDRPHRYGADTSSSILETTGTITFTAEGDSTVMAWDWQVQPKGWLRILTALFGPLGGRMERKIWTGLKRQLESA
jgi:uncharacterized protein YndB with AHSA1/START domain